MKEIIIQELTKHELAEVSGGINFTITIRDRCFLVIGFISGSVVSALLILFTAYLFRLLDSGTPINADESER